MMKAKRFSIVLFALALLATGCQDKGPVPNSLVQGTPGLQILDSRYVSTGDAAGSTVGGSGQNYAIFKIHFTNNISEQLFPITSHFVFTTTDGSRFNGVDSGSTALIGISNDYSPMKKGESRDFVIGFRVGLQQTGQIAYEY